jgi:hypothetical protein
MNTKNPGLNPHQSRKSKTEQLLLVFLLLFIANPYFFWQWYGMMLPRIVATLLALLIVYKNRRHINSGERWLILIYVFLWSFYMVNEFAKGARMGVLASTPYVLIGFIPFMKEDFWKNVFRYFTTTYAVLIGLSMVMWLAAIAGVISPIGEIGETNDSLIAQGKSYIVYPLTLVSTSNIDEFLRFCGPFDEPGVVGTLGALQLCAMRFNLKDWRDVIILISGILSASLFFYAIAIIFWLSDLLFVRKKMYPILLIFVGVIVAYNTTKDIPAVKNLVWNRVEWDSSRGTFAGNTRVNSNTQSNFQHYVSTGEIWLGVNDKEKYWQENFGSTSIYDFIAIYGILFSILYVLWVLFIGYKKGAPTTRFLLYCFVVVGCLYQRTNAFNILYIFLFISVANNYVFADMQKRTLKNLHQ